jgi:hypothetical protein
MLSDPTAINCIHTYHRKQTRDQGVVLYGGEQVMIKG